MTIVHLAGITPNGLTATRMVCGCLTKVKVHEAFKSMMPAHMIKNVEARGCVFQWIDKPFKVFYCSPGCFTQIRISCLPTCLGVFPDLLLKNTIHTICFRKIVVLLSYLCAARSKCNVFFFHIQDFVYALKHTNYDLLLEGVKKMPKNIIAQFSYISEFVLTRITSLWK